MRSKSLATKLASYASAPVSTHRNLRGAAVARPSSRSSRSTVLGVVSSTDTLLTVRSRRDEPQPSASSESTSAVSSRQKEKRPSCNDCCSIGRLTITGFGGRTPPVFTESLSFALLARQRRKLRGRLLHRHLLEVDDAHERVRFGAGRGFAEAHPVLARDRDLGTHGRQRVRHLHAPVRVVVLGVVLDRKRTRLTS